MKKGFTLIEVMVVIVILGILAAVAIPKLFGNVAKAKASEIPAAASTYINVLDAYLGANAILGNWSQIGYEAPGGGTTEHFCYSQGTLTDTMSISRIEEGVIGWGATNIVGLNNCTRPSWWSIVITPEGPSVKYEQNVSLSECASLVVGWKLGTTLTGSCETTNVNQVAQETPKEESIEEPKEESTEEPQPEPEVLPEESEPNPQPEQESEDKKPDQPVVEEPEVPAKTEEQIQKEEAAKKTIRDLYDAYNDSKNLIGGCGLGFTSSSKTCHQNRKAFYDAVINASDEFGEAFVKGLLTGDMKGAFDEAMDSEAK